jgi:hypothetical protein
MENYDEFIQTLPTQKLVADTLDVSEYAAPLFNGDEDIKQVLSTQLHPTISRVNMQR